MNKEKIYNIVIACICFILWFMPIESANGLMTWTFSIRVLFSPFVISFVEHLRELLIVVFGCISLAFLITHILKQTPKTKLLATIASAIYVIIWTVALFVIFPYKGNILFNLRRDIIWIVLYIAMLLAIVVLTILQYLPSRHPTKTERMQAQLDELQKQVDELKKGE